MSHKIKYLFASTILVASLQQALPAFSQTTVRETVTEVPADGTSIKKTVTETTVPAPVKTTKTETVVNAETHIISGRGDHHVRFMDFDLNGNGVLSFEEVAEMMFKIYDLDGNGVIDNNEYEKHTHITFMPLEKNTTITYDYGDGSTTTVVHTYESFMRDSRLALFAESREGLSAHEFTDKRFTKVDVNHDHGVDLKEWQGTYIASIDKANKEKARVNH